MSMTGEDMIGAVAALVNVAPKDVRGYVIIVHTHDDSEVCTGHQETVTNVRPGMARTLAITYAEKLRGLD